MIRLYLIRLQRNIFGLMLAFSLLLGFALAYLSSVLIVFATDIFGAEAVSVTTTLPQNRQRNREAVVLPREEFQQIVTGNLVRGKDISSPEQSLQDSNADLEQIRVVGLLAGPARYARASIRLEGEAEAYAIGEKVGTLKLVAIYINAVQLEDEEGNSHRVDLYEGKDKKKGSKAKESISSSGVQKKITLSRDRFNQYIKDQKELFRAKFAPFIKNGKIIGWRLLKVPSDHFLYSMGARSGDVVRRFNGQPLENQERLISMWQSLQTLDKLSIDVERGGKVITYNVNVQ